MPKPLSILVVVGALFALPANAQKPQRITADQKQCSDQFKAADLNNDGVLSLTEIGNAKQTLPSLLANQDRITRKQFMAVCSKGASKS